MTTLGSRSRRHLLIKRRFPAEVQSALDDFKRDFRTLSGRIRDRLADAVIARDINPTGDINAAVRRVLSNDSGELRVVLQDGAEEGAEAGRRMASRRFGLEIDFEVVPESTLSELNGFVDDIHGDVLDTIGDGVSDTLADAFDRGLDRDAVADLIQSELDNELGDAAAQRHARTLVQGASERGNHSAIRGSTAVGERWIATNDSRTRDTHNAAHGQIVPVDVPFRVGGAELMHPGDPTGPIKEIANCRCTQAPVFPDELSESELTTLRAGRRLNI